MKHNRDKILPLILVIFAVFLGIIAILTLLGPTIGSNENERNCSGFANKGELPFGEILTEQFTIYSSYEHLCPQIHFYNFSAKEGQTILFRIELQSTYGRLSICIAENQSFNDCSLLDESVSNNKHGAPFEFEVYIPHDGQYSVFLRDDGSNSDYQISMEDVSE